MSTQEEQGQEGQRHPGLSFLMCSSDTLPAGLICERGTVGSGAGDLWAAWSGNPSPGSLLGLLGTAALNIQPDLGMRCRWCAPEPGLC